MAPFDCWTLFESPNMIMRRHRKRQNSAFSNGHKRYRFGCGTWISKSFYMQKIKRWKKKDKESKLKGQISEQTLQNSIGLHYGVHCVQVGTTFPISQYTIQIKICFEFECVILEVTLLALNEILLIIKFSLLFFLTS